MAAKKYKNQAPKVEKVTPISGKATEVESTKTVDVKPQSVTETSTQKTMFEKTQPQTVTDESTPWLKILAIGALIFGLVVLLAILLLVVITRISPRVDSSLQVPVLKELPAYTNSEKIVLEGTAKDATQVIIYVDEKQESNFANVNQDGSFSYEFTFPSEKKYKFEAASLTGTIVKSRSDKSSPVEITFDKTAPSKTITFDQSNKTVDAGKVTVKGKAEADSTVTIKKDDKSYITTTDKDGNFEIKDVQLSNGENVFSVEVKDKAGNVVKANDLKIVYNGAGSLNGGGVKTGPELPNSAGLLEDALSSIGVNNLMFSFGLFALVLLMVNGSIVAIKLKRQN